MAKASTLEGLRDETARSGSLIAVFEGFFDHGVLADVPGVEIKSGENVAGATTLELVAPDMPEATRELYRRALHHGLAAPGSPGESADLAGRPVR